MGLNPDGTRIASGSGDTIQLWNAATGQPIGPPITGHTGSVNSVAFSPDGTRIVSGGGDGNDEDTIQLWSAATGRPIGPPITGHTGSVNSRGVRAQRAPASSRAALTRRLRLWDAETGEPIGQPMTGHTGSVSSVAFSPDGTRIVSGSADRPSGCGTRPPVSSSVNR